MTTTYIDLDDGRSPKFYIARSTLRENRPLAFGLDLGVGSQYVYLTRKQALDLADALYTHAEALSRAPEGEPGDE